MENHQEFLDIVVVGAGISGLGMAYNLLKRRESASFAVIESRERIAGTWDYFKYPGLRSDSDMYTFAYSFKPWRHKEYIGSAERIKTYLDEMVEENGIDRVIRFQTKIKIASWSSEDKTWTLVAQKADGSSYTIITKFLITCTGYYSYDAGYTPKFPGVDSFEGDIIHPQKWPESYDYANKDVVVIGSGATAFTIVPVMAETTKSMTMLQRSPSYVYNRPAIDSLYMKLNNKLPPSVVNIIMRIKFLWLQQFAYWFSKNFPKLARWTFVRDIKKSAADADFVEKHFAPNYKPWDQRVCMVPDNDLFESVKRNEVNVVTDTIDSFTKDGIKLSSGDFLPADLIVTATGLDLKLWGGIEVSVDEVPVTPTKLTNYKGMMFSQMPNFVTIFGYTNTSWTVKAELTYDYILKLLNHMDKHHYEVVFPCLEEISDDQGLVGLTSGYILRAASKLPKQGSAFPWRNKDFYIADLFAIKYSKLDDGILRFNDTQPLVPFHTKAKKLFDAEQEKTRQLKDESQSASGQMTRDKAILIHGMWSTNDTLQELETAVRKLGYDVGCSTLPYHKTKKDFTAEDKEKLKSVCLMDYIDAVQSEIDRCDRPPLLVGHSMGGLIALLLAQKNKLKGLILMSPAAPAGINPLAWSVVRVFSRNLLRFPFTGKLTEIDLNEIKFGIANSQSERLQKLIASQTSYESCQVTREVGLWFLNKRPQTFVDFRKISVPTIVISGEQDLLVPPRIHRKIASRITDAEIKSIPGGCHWTVGGRHFAEISKSIGIWHSKKYDSV